MIDTPEFHPAASSKSSLNLFSCKNKHCNRMTKEGSAHIRWQSFRVTSSSNSLQIAHIKLDLPVSIRNVFFSFQTDPLVQCLERWSPMHLKFKKGLRNGGASAIRCGELHTARQSDIKDIQQTMLIFKPSDRTKRKQRKQTKQTVQSMSKIWMIRIRNSVNVHVSYCRPSWKLCEEDATGEIKGSEVHRRSLSLLSPLSWWKCNTCIQRSWQGCKCVPVSSPQLTSVHRSSCYNLATVIPLALKDPLCISITLIDVTYSFV